MKKGNYGGNKKMKGSSSSESSMGGHRVLKFLHTKVGLISVTVAILAFFVAAYTYVLSAVPAVDLPIADTKEERSERPKPNSRHKKGSKKPKQPDFSESLLTSEQDGEFEELLKKKTITALEDGWIGLNPNPLPILKLSSNFKERQSQYEDLIQKHTPTLLVDDKLIDQWPIFRWDFFAKAQDKNISLSNCRYQWSSPVFLLGQERDKGGMLGSNHDLPLAYINVTLLQFIQSTFQEKIWLYWTDELEYLEKEFETTATVDHHYYSTSEKRKKKTTGWEYFIIQEKNLRVKNDEDNQEMNNKFNKTSSEKDLDKADEDDDEYDLDFWRPMIWMSHPGVISQSHYDTQHNMFIQLQGVKRFYLFPPATDLYSFPNIHYSYRQSQVPFHLPRNSSKIHYSFSKVNSENTKAYEVIVKPGDVLYIPPYWTHYVESLSLSLSLSILSPSTTEAALSEIYWQKVPFGEFRSSRYDRMRVIQYFFQHLFESFAALEASPSTPLSEIYSAVKFAEELYESRFAPLEATLIKPLSHIQADYFCHDLTTPTDNENGDEDANKLNHWKKTVKAQDTQFQQLVSNHSQSIQVAILNMNAMFRQFTSRDNTKETDSYYHDIKKIFLQDYMEQLVRWAVGPHYTAYFIKNCFNQYSSNL